MLRPLSLLLLLEATSVGAPSLASAEPRAKPQARPAGEECFSAYEGAQSSRRSGKLVRAKSELGVCSAVCPDALRRDCTEWLSEVDATLPRLSVEARGAAGETPSSLAVDVDGVAWATFVDVELDPGPHVVRVSATGYRPAERQVVLSAGKHARESFVLETEPRMALMPVESRPSKGPWVLGGAGGVMLLVAGTLSWLGWMDYGDMKDTCAPRCPNDRIDAVGTKWTAGGIVATTGALTIAGAILWHVLDNGPVQPPSARGALAASKGVDR